MTRGRRYPDNHWMKLNEPSDWFGHGQGFSGRQLRPRTRAGWAIAVLLSVVALLFIALAGQSG